MRHRRAIARGLAGLLGCLLLLDVLRRALGLADGWWLDLRALPGPLAQALRLAVGGLMTAFALRPRASQARHRATLAAAALVAAIALKDGLVWCVLVARGAVGSDAWLPLSALVAGAALVVAQGLGRCGSATSRPETPETPETLGALAVAGAGAVGLALALMTCFGQTDYRRPADAVVVLGARTYRDGRASLALADRVRTGCRLVKEGHAARLVLSGGPGDGATHETTAMRRLAIACGVPSQAILLDTGGLNTRHTARNASTMLPEGARVLAVSHGYHLPRVKLALEREGLRAYTVPADETRTLAKLPAYMLREVAAFWVYYLGDLRGA